MYLAQIRFIMIEHTTLAVNLTNFAFYKPNSAEDSFILCELLMWLRSVLCMKVLLFNTLFFDSHLKCMMEIETSLSRTSLDLYNQSIFKTRRGTGDHQA